MSNPTDRCATCPRPWHCDDAGHCVAGDAPSQQTTWRQEGFAVVTDSALGPPLVLAFHTTRWEADAELEKTRKLLANADGTLLQRAAVNARVVPASLSFATEAANV